MIFSRQDGLSLNTSQAFHEAGKSGKVPSALSVPSKKIIRAGGCAGDFQLTTRLKT
jgi:hypothetical protein